MPMGRLYIAPCLIVRTDFSVLQFFCLYHSLRSPCGERRSAATVRHYLQAVKLFFAWTKAESLYPDIAENIRTPRIDSDAPPKRDALTAAEAMDILSYIDGIEATTATEREQKARIKALYLLAITAGTRTIELSRANVRDVVTRGKNATIYLYGKGHDEPDRPIAIPTETADAVREYIDIRADKPTSDSALFVATGNRSGGQRLAATTISRLLKDLLRRAGYNSERLTAHSLRHTAATAALEATGDIYAVQKFCRHSSPATTEKYLHTAENTRETSDRLMAYYHSATDNSNATNIN